MLASVLRQLNGIVERGIVGHDYVYVLIHVPSDDVVQIRLIQIVRGNEVHMSATLTDADDRSFLLPPLLIRGLATDVCLINFHGASQLVAFGFFHCGPDSVAEIPSGFVTDSQGALQLIRRHPLAALTEQVRAQIPLPQRQVRIVEDRASHDRELIVAGIAVVLKAVGDLSCATAARGAGRAIGPAQMFKRLSAGVIVAELVN